MIAGRILRRIGRSRKASTPDKAEEVRRWELDVLLAEFSAIRAEIDALKAQIERTYSFLFAVIAAIAASQALSKRSLDVVNHHPWVFLGAALLALWFPINNLLMIVDMTTCGAYVREVLTPKINLLIQSAAGGDGLATKEAPIATFLDPADRKRLQSPMAWEDFLGIFRVGTRGRRAIFIPLYFARTALLYVPTILLLARFVSLSPSVNAFELAIVALIAFLVVMSVAARFSIASFIRLALRRGVFRPRP